MDDVDQPFDVLLALFEVFAVDVRVFEPAVEQGQNVALDAAQRSLEFVRNVADELLAVLFVFAQAGDFEAVAFGPGLQFALHLGDDVLAPVLFGDFARFAVA